MGQKPSTSSDPEIVRAAGEGMVKRHSDEGDKREAREAAQEEGATDRGGKAHRTRREK